MKLSEFDFDLPKDLIAKYPKYPRGNSRLLYLNGDSKIYDYKFAEILRLFKKGDLLVLNNSKVIPAYLVGQISNSSSGIREGSYLKVPVVNIGTRQENRERGNNVIDTNNQEKNIYTAILKQIKNKKIRANNIYGNGTSSKKILNIIKNISLEINKKFRDI